MAVNPEAREALERALFDVAQEHCGVPCYLPPCTCVERYVDAVKAAGWAPVPPGAVVVQTEGEAWEAMVERALDELGWDHDADDPHGDHAAMTYALHAAITPPKQESADDR